MTVWGRRDGQAPLVIAHRGASRQAPENTLAAFRRARLEGADGVELDVQRCATGEVVVFHDRTLRRLARRADAIADLPLAAVREVQLVAGATIPLLSEVLEELGPMLVNVEIKAPRALSLATARLCASVAAVLAHHDAGRRALVSSFNPFALAEFGVLARRVPTGLLFSAEHRRPLREAWARRLLRPAALHPDQRLVSADRVARWRREGYALYVWTVDDEAEIRRLAALGVDGVITNDPAATRGWLGDRS